MLSPSRDGIDPDGLRYVRLDAQDLSGFDCTDDGVDEQGLQEFIQKEARDYQAKNLGVTYLVLHENVIVAFVTVAMTAIKVQA